MSETSVPGQEPGPEPGPSAMSPTKVVLGGVALAAVIAGLWWVSRPAPTPIDKPEVAPPKPKDATLVQPSFMAVTGLPAWSHTTGARGERLLPETLGGGAAIADLDNDGALDIILADGLNWSGDAFASAPSAGSTGLRILRSAGGPDASEPRFDAVSLANRPIYAMGVYAVDFDGDDRTDLYVTGVKTPHTPGHLLLRNVTPPGGTIAFEDVTEARGLTTEPGWGTAAVWFDADLDGDLDLLTAQYVKWSPEIDRSVGYTLTGVGRSYGPPTGFEGADPIFYRQQADGSFVDDTTSAGFIVRNRATGVPVGKTLGAIATDIDGDGDQDVVLANDTVANFVFLNDGQGRFMESGVSTGIAFDKMGAATGAMGIDSAVIVDERAASDTAKARPGKLAIAIGNFANEPDSFFTSPTGRLQFTDDAILCGVGVPTRRVLTFGLLLEDVNQDGALDVVQSNGHLEPEIGVVQAGQEFHQPGQVLLQSPGRGMFQLAQPEAHGAVGAKRVGRGLASGDLNADGAVDFVFTSNAGAAEVILGQTSGLPGGQVIVVSGQGAMGNRQGLGALLVATLQDGSTRLRSIAPHRGYLSSSEPVARLVLAPGESIRSLTLRWPDGVEQVLEVPARSAPTALITATRD
ncbi:MAG: CRTAC1 family protein [Planctomycetota bacterium]|nr:CRTAC1 family protein [Planctomycetota bacterium]MDA1105757.1 CRTAC1 family protein [Planctomycetota bacterium]